MAVGVDDVLDRLVRNLPLRLGHYGKTAGLALSRLDDGDVILEVDGDSRVAAGNQKHAVAQLL